MAYFVCTGIPWMQKVDRKEVFTTGNGFPGWKTDQVASHNKCKRWGVNKTVDGITFSASTTAHGSSDDTTGHDIYKYAGLKQQIYNGKVHTTNAFIGSYVDDDAFYSDNYTYPSNASTYRALNVMGFGCYYSCKGSYSNKGGQHQAYMNKLALFYAAPNEGFKRKTCIANIKVAGDHALDKWFPNNSTNYWISYRVSDSDIQEIKDGNYLFMGMGMQFTHGQKVGTHDAVCNLSNMVLMCGDSYNGMVGAPGDVKEIQIIADQPVKLADWEKEFSIGGDT